MARCWKWQPENGFWLRARITPESLTKHAAIPANAGIHFDVYK
jgi:hypothetical protein